jgi:hypothetical protein
MLTRMEEGKNDVFWQSIPRDYRVGKSKWAAVCFTSVQFVKGPPSSMHIEIQCRVRMQLLRVG